MTKKLAALHGAAIGIDTLRDSIGDGKQICRMTQVVIADSASSDSNSDSYSDPVQLE